MLCRKMFSDVDILFGKKVIVTGRYSLLGIFFNDYGLYAGGGLMVVQSAFQFESALIGRVLFLL